jgi:5-methylcytosine-specific restriction enzyme subunit McrC
VTRVFEVPAWGTRAYELSGSEAADLQRTGLARVEVGDAPGVYVLRGLTSVGVAAGPTWELRVASHLDVREMMFLLTYARNPNGWRTIYAHFAEAPTLLAAVAWGFAATAEQALRTGPIRGYRRLEEASSVLRGRLRLGEQLARGGLPMPVLIARDEYDIDIPENRVLYAATRLLSRLPLVATSVRARLRRVIALLDGVTLIPDFRSLRPPPITRLNAHYEPALVLADLVLRNTSVSTRAGAIRSVTFAFELHRVFEDFLEVALATALRHRGAILVKQPKDRSLDHEGTLGLEPDFVAMRSGKAVCVLDAKFKRLEQDLGDDAYQLLAYLLEFGPRSGFLIAASGTRTDRRVRAVDKILGVRPLALDRPPDEVLAEVDALADETINLDPDRVHKVIAVQPLKVLDGLLDETT